MLNKKSLVTYSHPRTNENRLGVCIENMVLDFSSSASGLKSKYEDESFPTTMLEFIGQIALLQPVLDEIVANRKAMVDSLSAGQDYFELSDVKLLAPLPNPGKIVHTAGNYREHALEGKEGGWDFQIPPWISFLKNPSAICGHEDDIIYPPITKELDHEIELAIVIGKEGRYISEESAWDHIAGFTVFNDITARDVQRREMASGLLNLGKNLDTFAPFGPALVLRDDIGHVHDLKIELRVNGEPRQVSTTANLSVRIEEIVSHWSVLTLYPGDIVTTGTVSGVAAFRPDPEPFFLKPGDVMEAEIENIGILRNRIVADRLSTSERAWFAKRAHLFEGS